MVHLGRLVGPAGFSRAVAIKRMHRHLAADQQFARMFVEEARLTSRIRHPNVVSVLDVVAEHDELLLVMEHIQGESLSLLRRSNERVPPAIASTIVMGALLGLHAAHVATDESGEPLDIVHHDVSPQNIMVGTDGVARVVDFGVAMAVSTLQRPAQSASLRGKIAYMAPERLLHHDVDRRADLFAMGVVLWELLASRRLFQEKDPDAAAALVLRGCATPPSHHAPELSAAVDQVCMTALAVSPDARFATARDMAVALSRALPPATSIELGDFVEHAASASLRKQHAYLAALEEGTLVRTVGSASLSSSEGADAAPLSESMVTETDLSLAPSATDAASVERAQQLPTPFASLTPLQPPPAQRRLASVAIAVTAIGLALAAAAAIVALRPDAEQPQPDAIASGSVGQALVLSPSNTNATTTQPGAPPRPPESGPTASATGAQVPSAHTAPRASATASVKASPRTLRPSRPPPARGASNDRCKPPFTVDAQGDKHFKVGCFH